jgi:hypothetical protein
LYGQRAVAVSEARKGVVVKFALGRTPQAALVAGNVEAGGRTQMRQLTLASQDSFEKYGRQTRREKFLEEMERIMP